MTTKGTRTPTYCADNREWVGPMIPEWLARRQELTWTPKAVWGYLYRCLGSKYGFAFPSQKRISEDLGVSLRATKDAIANLKEHRLIAAERRTVNYTNWESPKRKLVYLIAGNHQWADGAKRRARPVEEKEDRDDTG